MHPTIEQFRQSASEGNVVPVWTEIPADLETPASIYLKLRNEEPSFLLESVERGEQVGRYSFLGFDPAGTVVVDGIGVRLRTGADEERLADADSDPLVALESLLSRYRPAGTEGLPEFYGGLVGYLGYDAIRYFERVPLPTSGGLSLPDGVFLLAETLVIFDHVKQMLLLVSNARIDDDVDDAYARSVERIRGMISSLHAPIPTPTDAGPTAQAVWTSNTPSSDYQNSVRRVQQYIRDGDIFQGVLSQRLSHETLVDPFSVYRELRRLNPSPYMYYLDLPGELRIIGSSPETMVRLQGRRAEIRPIAGTRPRGETIEQDRAHADDLLADPKECAEHIMLVDLGRNDLGRVCAYGTVEVPTLMTIERYSHVMHIVSVVEGHLRPEMSGFDLLRATFPAGTVSGAPKIRAMEIISELEPDRRGPYAGIVGYFGFSGTMDTCIAIRTLVMRGQTIHVQAGAGIVADSDPEREYQETLSKAKALSEAVSRAEAVGSRGGRG